MYGCGIYRDRRTTQLEGGRWTASHTIWQMGVGLIGNATEADRWWDWRWERRDAIETGIEWEMGDGRRETVLGLVGWKGESC